MPLGTKSNKFDKWLLSWEGIYKIVKFIFDNSYMVETLQGERLPRALNRRYLKKYYSAFGKTLEDEDGRCLNIALTTFFLSQCILCVKFYFCSGTYFLACKAHQKGRGTYVDSKNWQVPRSTGLACVIRVGLEFLSRILF